MVGKAKLADMQAVKSEKDASAASLRGKPAAKRLIDGNIKARMDRNLSQEEVH